MRPSSLTLHNRALSSPTASTLFSRRRRARQASGQTRLPDWVWGAGLGVLVLLFVGGFFFVREVTGGGGGGPCDSELVRLQTSDISAEGFIQEDADLGRVILLLNQGDREGAEATFNGPVHNFTHNVDPPVRKVDKDAAKTLCEAVIELEDAISTNAGNATVSGLVTRVRELLRDAAETLGYPRPEGARYGTA